MNRSQRELIKEAYQEGYYQALYEESIRKSLGKRIGDFIGGKLSRLFRGKADDAVDAVDDIVPTNPIDDLANIIRNIEPTGGSTPKLMKQLITIYSDNPGALKQGQIVVIQAKKSLASDCGMCSMVSTDMTTSKSFSYLLRSFVKSTCSLL